jgi:hypothetical protein
MLPIFRDDVDLDAASRRFRGACRRLDDDFLEGVGVVLEATAAEHPRIHAAEVIGHVVGALTVDAEKCAVASHAADIVERRGVGSAVGADDQRDELRGTPAGRDRIEDLARERLLLLDVLRVHHRGFPRDRDRLLE